MNAGRLAILLLVLAATGAAQDLIALETAERLQASFANRIPLPRGCEIGRVAPALGYSLHYESGYSLQLLRGAGQGITVLLRVTPIGGSPVYLLQRHPSTDVHGSGAFRAGAGRYDVAATVGDDAHLLCRGQWQIRVRPNRGETMRPGSIAPLAGAIAREPRPPSAGRVTVLLHAAHPSDASMLSDMLSALLERLPSRDVRLVVFSLSLQKELLRLDSVGRDALRDVARITGGLRPGIVDVQTLANRRGHLSFLAGLMNRELREGDPHGAVVIIGRPAATYDHVPEDAIEVRHTLPLFYLILGTGAARTRAPADPERIDTLRAAIADLDGRTLPIARPEDFGAGLDQIVRSLAYPEL
jgi:hypothetical protein